MSDIAINEKGKINANSVNVRKDAGKKYDRLYYAQKGDIVKILARKNGTDKALWYQIENESRSSTKHGWVLNDFVDPYTEQSGETGGGSSSSSGETLGEGIVIANGTLNCRKGPSKSNELWGTFKEGQKIPIYSCSTAGWYKTFWPVGGTNVGYVMQEFISLGGSGSTGDDSSGSSNKPLGEGIVIANNTLNCRKGPAKSYELWGTFKEGQKITIYPCSTAGWYETRWPVGGTNVGYVMQDYIALNGNDPNENLDAKWKYGKAKADKLNIRNLNKSQLGQWPLNRIGIVRNNSSYPEYYETFWKGSPALVLKSYIDILEDAPDDIVSRMQRVARNELPLALHGQAISDYYQVGMKSDGSNEPGAWCQAFVNWLAKHCGMPSSTVPNTTSTSLAIAWHIKNGGHFKFINLEHKTKMREDPDVKNATTSELTAEEIAYRPAAGDFVYFRTKEKDHCSHVGFVDIYDTDTQMIHTIEGNTTLSPYGDGNMMGKQKIPYNDSRIVGYGKLEYPAS